MSSESHVEQFAWIRNAALGDCLIATAALLETCRRFSKAKGIVVGPKFWTDLLDPQHWPQLNGIFVIETGSAYRGQLWTPEGSCWRLQESNLKLFDVMSWCQAVVNLRIESFRYLWPSLVARVPVRIGTCDWPASWMYTHWAPWLGKDPVVHERDWQLWVVGAVAKSRRWGMGVAQARENFANEPTPAMIEWRRYGGLPKLRGDLALRAEKLRLSESFVLVNPTASRREKAWPASRFAALVENLRRKGLRVLVTGAPHEANWLREISDEDLVCPESLADVQALISMASVLVTNTSSLQFLAATTGTSVLTLMGRADPKIWGPLGLKDCVVRAPVPMTPGMTIFEHERICYEQIKTETVVASVLQMIQHPSSFVDDLSQSLNR